MAINYSIQTHSTKPQDVFEPPFAALHYFVSEHIAGEEKSYSCVVVNTDETREFSDIDALKAAFFKRARTFACNQNLIGIGRGEIDASSASVNTMSAMIIGALFDFVSQAALMCLKLTRAIIVTRNLGRFDVSDSRLKDCTIDFINYCALLREIVPFRLTYKTLNTENDWEWFFERVVRYIALGEEDDAAI